MCHRHRQELLKVLFSVFRPLAKRPSLSFVVIINSIAGWSAISSMQRLKPSCASTILRRKM